VLEKAQIVIIARHHHDDCCPDARAFEAALTDLRVALDDLYRKEQP